jgi:hypothetical protein
MERIIVTVKREGENEEHDLEVPADLSAEALVRELAVAWGWRETYAVYAQPLGRLLAQHETFAQTGVWDGARLILQPSGKRGADQSRESAPQQGPVKRWRPLEVVTGQPPVEPEPPPPGAGYTWKRVDED